MALKKVVPIDTPEEAGGWFVPHVGEAPANGRWIGPGGPSVAPPVPLVKPPTMALPPPPEVVPGKLSISTPAPTRTKPTMPQPRWRGGKMTY